MEASSHMTWEYYSYCGKSVVEHLQQVQDYLWSHLYLEICFLVISQQRLEGWGIWYNFHFNHQLTDVLVIIIVSPLCYCNNIYISYIHIHETLYILGPIHTNLFQKDLHPHLSFLYRFCLSTLPHCSAVHHFGYSRSSGLAPVRVYFDDVAVFRKHRFLYPHWKTGFSKSIVFKSLHSGERFQMAPFSLIVFGIVA